MSDAIFLILIILAIVSTFITGWAFGYLQARKAILLEFDFFIRKLREK